MIRSLKPPRTAALLCFATFALCAFLLLGPASGARAAAPVFHHESLAAFEKQLAAGQIKTAEFNKKAHSLHLLLSNGEDALVDYPSGHEEPGLAAKLEAKGVPVSIEKVKGKSTGKAHHTLRYIAGAIVVVVIVVVTAVLLIDRRRKLAGAGGAQAPPPAGAGPA
jgi:hypothetical protein